MDTLKTKRTDVFLVDPRNIVVKENFNVRSDMGDIESLMNSIVETGLQVPLKAAKVRGEDKYELVDGHRRMAAINLALEKGHNIKFIEVIPFKGNEEDKVFSMVITGTGQKTLNDVEMAEAIKRLTNFGYKVEEIASKIGKSIPQVYNYLNISLLPKLIKNKIEDNKISASLVLSIIREEKDIEKQMEMVEEAISNAGGVKKATAKDSTRIKRKSDKQKLKEAYTILKEKESEKVELLDFLLNMKDKSVEQVVEFFD